MSNTIPVRLPREIYDEAHQVAPLLHRTVGQQLAYWAELGRALETSTEAPAALVQRLLVRSRLQDDTDQDRTSVIAAIEAGVESQIQSLDLRAVLQQASYVVADESGEIREIVESVPSARP